MVAVNQVGLATAIDNKLLVVVVTAEGQEVLNLLAVGSFQRRRIVGNDFAETNCQEITQAKMKTVAVEKLANEGRCWTVDDLLWGCQLVGGHRLSRLQPWFPAARPRACRG